MTAAQTDHHASIARSFSSIHIPQGARQRSISPLSCNLSDNIDEYGSIFDKAHYKRYRRSVTPTSPVDNDVDDEAPKIRRPLHVCFHIPEEQDAKKSMMKQRSTTVSLTKGFRTDYEIGQGIRSMLHMITHASPQQSIDAADTLEKHDFAFIKRRDGSYTYAILAKRTENSFTFVMSTNGSVKKVSRKHWSELVRLVNTVQR